MDGGHSLRQAALVSRVSFEPLSMLDQQNGLTRDGSGVSAQSDSELEAWRVRNLASWARSGNIFSWPAATRRCRLHGPWHSAAACRVLVSSWLAHCPIVSCGPLLQEEHPCALHNFDQIAALAANKLVAVFLDYDGAPPTWGCAAKRDTGGVASLAVHTLASAAAGCCCQGAIAGRHSFVPSC